MRIKTIKLRLQMFVGRYTFYDYSHFILRKWRMHKNIYLTLSPTCICVHRESRLVEAAGLQHGELDTLPDKVGPLQLQKPRAMERPTPRRRTVGEEGRVAVWTLREGLSMRLRSDWASKRRLPALNQIGHPDLHKPSKRFLAWYTQGKLDILGNQSAPVCFLRKGTWMKLICAWGFWILVLTIRRTVAGRTGKHPGSFRRGTAGVEYRRTSCGNCYTER